MTDIRKESGSSMGTKKSGFKVGASKKAIHIPDDFFPYRSFRGRYFTGLHDEIYVRCLFLESEEDRALLLSMELGDLGEIDEWQNRISRISGVPADHIFLSVTHNHAAPHVSDDYNQDVADRGKTEEFGKWVWAAAEEAVREAATRAIPAQMGFGTGSCDINVNRDYIRDGRSIMAPNPRGISDKTVAVMGFEDLEGKPIAYLMNYAVHGAVMFDSDLKDGGMLVSGDLPGETCRIIEKRNDEKVVALFTSGAAGDQIPRYMSHRTVHDGKGGISRIDAREAGWVLLQVQAENLADEVLRVAETMDIFPFEMVLKAAQKKYSVPGQKKTEDPMNVPEDYRFEDDGPVSMPLGVLMLGPVVLVCVPGEPVCSIGLDMKKTLPLRHVVVISHCNGSLSYISDDFGYEHLTFEAVVSHFRQGCGRQAIIDGANELLHILTGETRG